MFDASTRKRDRWMEAPSSGLYRSLSAAVIYAMNHDSCHNHTTMHGVIRICLHFLQRPITVQKAISPDSLTHLSQRAISHHGPPPLFHRGQTTSKASVGSQRLPKLSDSAKMLVLYSVRQSALHLGAVGETHHKLRSR